jgi:hypothetical protein
MLATMKLHALLMCAVLAMTDVACDPGTTDPSKDAKSTAAASEAGKAGGAKAADAKTGETKAVDDTKVVADAGPDPCALISRGRAREALHSPVEAGVRSGNSCKWKATTGPGSVVIQISSNGQALYDRQLKLLGSEETLTELGDAAFRSGSIVGVRSGDRYVAITVAPNIGEGELAKPADAVQLARDAIAALP